jgi:hypothetical protein
MKVATIEGMQACAEHGHRWAWRSTWHDIGFAECWRCGATGPVGTDRTPPVMSGFSTSDEGAKLDMAPAAPKAARRTERRSPGRPRGSAKPERDAAILAAVAAGTPPKAIAAAYGIHATRIAQIRSRARREDAERCSPRSPETFHGNVSAKRSEERRGEETPLTPLSLGEGGSARAEHQQQSLQQRPGRAGAGAW